MGKRKLTLDIGASTLKLAEYSVVKDSYELVAYAVGTLPAPADSVENAPLITAVLEEMAKEKGIKPGPVAVAVSGQVTFTKFAAIPFAGGQEKFDQLVRYEIEQNIPFPIDEMVCDYQILGETETGDKSVMIVSAKTDLLEAVSSAVQAANFSPTVIDVSPLALTSAVRGGEEGGCTVILDIGQKTSSLVIMEGDKIYDRSIPVAGGSITREIASQFGCSPEEAEALKREKAYVSLGGVTEDEDPDLDRLSKICRSVLTRLTAEISRSINFYRSQQGGGVPVKFYLSGAGSLLPQIDTFFAESLQIEVEFVNPLEMISVSSRVDEEALSSDIVYLGSSVGLLMHEEGRSFASINLMPPSLVTARADKARIPFVAASAVFAVGAAVLAYLAAGHMAEVSSATLDAVLARSKKLKAMEAKVKKASDEFELANAKAEELKALLQRRAQTVLEISLLKRALAPGMWIEKWESSPAGENAPRAASVTIRGWADELKAAVAKSKSSSGVAKSTASELVVERLKMSPLIDPASVQVTKMTTLGKNNSLEEFVVTLNFGKVTKESSK